MKKTYFIRLLFILFLASCTHELINNPENSDFAITDAKSYFEKNATDLQNVNFSPKVTSKSFESCNITPDWKAARITQTGKITTVEIPLDGDVCKVAQTFRIDSSKKLYGFTTGVTTKLVIQKHSKCEAARQFVVTMIDDVSQRLKEDKTRDYYGKNNYSGYIIISAVTGEYLESFQSVNGRWKRVYIAPGTKEDLEDPQNVNLRLFGTYDSSTAYRWGEGGGSRCSKCGNTSSMCTCCKVCNGKGCSSCTVTVYPTCRKCNYTGPGATTGSCYCCSRCHDYPCRCSSGICSSCFSNPCVCESYSCKYCGSRYCTGSCQGGGGVTPPGPDPDECYHTRCPVCRKMIRTQARSSTGYSICDSHEYCDNDGMCVKVELNVSKNLITLGDSYTITLKLTPANTVCYDITYYIIKDGREFTLPQEGLPTSLTTMARTPGAFQLKAEIMQDETHKTYLSNTVRVTHQFPDRNEILRQQVVIDGMNYSWAQMLAATDATWMQEFGGTVIINTKTNNTGNLYRYARCKGPQTPYTSSSVNITLEEIDNDFGPDRGGEFTVLFFHTHPPFWEYKGTKIYERKVGPSDIDISNHITVPAVVKDYYHATDSIRTSMPKSEYVNSEKLYHYGIDRKKN